MNAKTSLESPSQGSSVFPENNGPSLHYSPKPSPVLGHEMPGEGARGVLKSGCILSTVSELPRLVYIEFCERSYNMGFLAQSSKVVWDYPVVWVCVCVCAVRAFWHVEHCRGAKEMPGKSLPLLRSFVSNKGRPLELSAWRLSWYVEGYLN